MLAEKTDTPCFPMTERQLELFRAQLHRLKHCGYPFYENKFKDVNPEDIKTQADFERLIPFSSKLECREAYPLGAAAVPREQIVRIQASTGTTGAPVIAPHTKKDLEDAIAMIIRSLERYGVTEKDTVQIMVGYGLWPAGIGYQLACEKMGCMSLPVGPGNTEKQLQMMQDFQTTVTFATTSFTLAIAEAIAKRGLRDKVAVKKCIIGSEHSSPEMRARIKACLGADVYESYGFTECYGAGIGPHCPEGEGIHIWDDFFYVEILDPQTGVPVPPGQVGEITITTLVKEAAPLIRFRTHDLAAFIPGECKCGWKHPHLTFIMGRTDDMVKVKANIVFPSTIEDVIGSVPGTSSEYHAIVEHTERKDEMTLLVEVEEGIDREATAKAIAQTFKARYNLTPIVKLVSIGELPRSEKKTKRIEDRRV